MNGFTTAKPAPYGKGTVSNQGIDYAYDDYGMKYDAGGDYTHSAIVVLMLDGDQYLVVKSDKTGISAS